MTAQNRRVAAQVRAVIRLSYDTPVFRDLLLHLMARPGRILAPGGSSEWSKLVLGTARALDGDQRSAVIAAAAVEFIAATVHFVDDLVDDEWDEEAGEPGRGLNASLALNWLAHRCLDELVGRVGLERTHLIGNLITQGILAACAGEDLDLLLETTADVSEDLAHEMTCRKSGSLIAMACQVGAAVATDDPEVLELMGAFGRHVGVVAQLLNDLAGIAPDVTQRGNDLRRKKKTLPITYALRCAKEEEIVDILSWYHGDGALSDRDEERLAALIRDLGAVHYTSVVADSHRREALATLRRLGQVTGKEKLYRLRRLVPMIRRRI
ncbi:MAG TPA: polyprenyl synthetase family protein [Nitrolancea sp.]|nr:polyprenyl synthetase family protein [Nitrolancea sp.]